MLTLVLESVLEGRQRKLGSRKSADIKEDFLAKEFRLFKTVQSIVFLRVWESSATALG